MTCPLTDSYVTRAAQEAGAAAVLIAGEVCAACAGLGSNEIQVLVTGRWVCDDRFYGLVNRSNR